MVLPSSGGGCRGGGRERSTMPAAPAPTMTTCLLPSFTNGSEAMMLAEALPLPARSRSRTTAGMLRQQASHNLGRRCYSARSSKTAEWTRGIRPLRIDQASWLPQRDVDVRRFPGAGKAGRPPSASIDDVHRHSDESAPDMQTDIRRQDLDRP